MSFEYAGVRGAGEEPKRHEGFAGIPAGISCGSWKLHFHVLEARHEDPNTSRPNSICTSVGILYFARLEIFQGQVVKV